MSEHSVWINGGLVAFDAAVISVADRGFLSGDGVFEAIKAQHGRPFALRRHLDRLERSAAVIGLPVPDRGTQLAAVADVLAANRDRCGAAARVRITLTAGIGQGVHRVEGESTLVVTADPLGRLPVISSVMISPWPRNERSATAGAKTTSYAENAAILTHARRLGFDEAILADTQGRLCEGTTCNVVVALAGELVTPSLATGCLSGVTRDLALEWGIVREADVGIDVLDETAEVLLTSTTRDLQPVHRVGARSIAAPGPLGAAAMAEFARRATETNDP